MEHGGEQQKDEGSSSRSASADGRKVGFESNSEGSVEVSISMAES
jgi:hypothetical protein